MEFLTRNRLKEVIFLTPVKAQSDHLSQNKIRILYCDAKANIDSTVAEDSVYRLARNYIQKLESEHKYGVILGVEVISGNYVPFAVEISSEQASALERIFEHAIKRGIVPYVLKKYPKDIIKLGKDELKEIRKQYEQSRLETTAKGMPEVLKRLADYPEEGIAVAVPIYKAQYHYPLVILKRLASGEPTQKDMQRVLILDNEGDLGIIRVPRDILGKTERKLRDWKKKSGRAGCILYSRDADNLIMSYMEISEFQRKALNTIKRHFEETGHGKRPISTEIQGILTKAKGLISSGYK